MHTRKNRILLLISLLIVSLTLAGCQPASTPAPAPEKPAEPQPTDAKLVLTVAQAADATHLDPNVQLERYSTNVVVNLFDPLLKRDENMVPKPHLATSVEALDDLTWEVKLRENVTFHNGEPIDAQSVKFTVDRIFDPALKSVLPTWLRGITEVKIIDSHTVHILTEMPMPLMLQNLTMIYPVPPKYVTEVGNEEFSLKPVGSGPYKLKEWQRDQKVILEAVDGHWLGRPAYDEVHFHFIPEEESRVSALLAGNVDIVFEIPPAGRRRVDAASGLEVRAVEAGRVQLLQISVTDGHPLLQDKRVRQAIAYAIDTEAIIEHVMFGAAFRISTILNPKNFGFHPYLKAYEYDPAKARQLIKEAGFEGAEFVINTNPATKSLAEALAAQLRQVGLNASIATFERAAQLAGWRAHSLGGHAHLPGLLSQTWDADGLLYLRFAKDEPMAYYYEPKVDDLVKKGRTTMNEDERRAVYWELMEILHEEMPIIPLYGVMSLYGVKENIVWEPRSDEYMFLYEARPR